MSRRLVVPLLALLVAIGSSVVSGLQASSSASGRRPRGVEPREQVWDNLRLRAAPIRARASDEYWQTRLTVRSEELVVQCEDGAVLEIQAASVTALGYSRQPFREWIVGVGLIPLPARGAFGKSGAHLISIEFTDVTNKRHGLLLEAKKGDFENILRTIAGVTRLKVSVTAEDRKRLAHDVPTTVVAEPPSGVLPDVPKLPVRSLSGFGKMVQSLAFSPDGTKVATVDDGGMIRFWQTASGLADGMPIQARRWPPVEMVFSPDGTRLTGWCYKSLELVVWDVTNRTQVSAVTIELDGPFPFNIALSPDGSRAAVGGERASQPTLMLLDLHSDKPQLAPLVKWEPPFLPRAAFSTDGTRLLAWSGGTIRIWRTDTGEALGEVSSRVSMNGAVDLTADGKEVLVAEGGRLTRFDVTSNDALGSGGTDLGWRSYFSPDRRVVAITDYRRSVTLWDGNTLTSMGEPLVGHRGQLVHEVAFDPRGARIATITPGHIVVWDVLTQRPLGQCVTGPVASFAGWSREWSKVWFAPDGRTVAATRDGAREASLCDLQPIDASPR